MEVGMIEFRTEPRLSDDPDVSSLRKVKMFEDLKKAGVAADVANRIATNLCTISDLLVDLQKRLKRIEENDFYAGPSAGRGEPPDRRDLEQRATFEKLTRGRG
jgi:hypothetical protein